MLKVHEIFTSVNGEGPSSGELATFIRLSGCNLQCSYCDTLYANTGQEMTASNVYDACVEAGASNIVITGGEPMLWWRELKDLVEKLSFGFQVDIETNGSIDITLLGKGPRYIMDYKLPSSGMEDRMNMSNLAALRESDVLKMVCGTEEDITKALEIAKKVNCKVYLSPVFGQIEPVRLVERLKEEMLNGVAVQLQIHKIIWPEDMRGV